MPDTEDTMVHKRHESRCHEVCNLVGNTCKKLIYCIMLCDTGVTRLQGAMVAIIP